MPLLSRMVGTPLAVDIGPGAVAALAPLLADRRISSGGHVAVVVGPGQGEQIAETLRPQLENAEIWQVEGGSVTAAMDLAKRLRTVFNPKALEWNNAYSLWCARGEFGRGVLLANGDTVHPSSVEESLLSGRNGDDLVIALDQAKTLGEEEMKVHLTDEGLLDAINKSLDPATAAGEYIGVTLIEPHAAAKLAEALQATFERDPQLYYEDGFQEFADRGGRVRGAAIGEVAWVEVDDDNDLARAREVACHC